MNDPGGPGTDVQPPRSPQCPWCAASVTEDAAQCPACGAAIAQRESIGGLKIPGLTSVDPALEDFDKRPLQLRGPSAAQGVAPALIVGAVAGGPVGLVAIGGVAAVAAAEFLGAQQGGPGSQNLDDVGRPSELLLQALKHADDAAEDGGRSIWRDLPPPVDSRVDPPAEGPAEASDEAR